MLLDRIFHGRRVAALRTQMLGSIAYAQSGRHDAYFDLARDYLRLAELSRFRSPAQGAFIGIAAAALVRFLDSTAEAPHAWTHQTAELVSRILAAQSKYGGPSRHRDPLIALREIGALFDKDICDPRMLVMTTTAIE